MLVFLLSAFRTRMNVARGGLGLVWVRFSQLSPLLSQNFPYFTRSFPFPFRNAGLCLLTRT